MKLIFGVFLAVLLCVLISAKPFQEGQESNVEESQHEQAIDLLRRITRQAVSKPTCKYQKGPWSACDPQTKKRTRTLSLKKGSKSECEEVKVLSKDCKGKRQKNKNANPKNRDRQRQNKKQEKMRNKQQQE